MTEILKEKRDSAIGAYAPGNYSCTCFTCDKQFDGHKLSTMCRPCAVEQMGAKLLPSDLDMLARRYGLVLARDVGVISDVAPIKGLVHLHGEFRSGWSNCRAAMLNWREVEVGDD